MKESSKFEKHKPRFTGERFSEYLPSAKIVEIAENEIPKIVMEKFEEYSRRWIPPEDYKPRDFEFYGRIDEDHGDIIYLTQQLRVYGEDGDTEKLTYFVETRNGERIGHAELRNNISNQDSYFRNKPFVGLTDTEEDYRNQGLGLRRLKIMNAYSQSMYGLPLYSDPVITPTAENRWKKLVQEGLAEEVREGEKNRYVFKQARNE